MHRHLIPIYIVGGFKQSPSSRNSSWSKKLGPIIFCFNGTNQMICQYDGGLNYRE